MPKNKLFDEDSEEEVAIKTENEYAKRYDAWREKEEKHKLEQKYGSKALDSDASSSSDSEDESDEPLEVSEETETQFLKTLALLKTKDPRIYDPGYKFFDEKLEKEKEKEDNMKKVVFTDSDDDDDDDSGNIFSIEKKAEVEEKQEQEHNKDGKLKDYLLGKVEHVEDDVEKELAPLKALWSDPKLNEGEAFLRDYILNKRYLEEGAGEAGAGAVDRLRDDAELEADEEMVEEQGKFERAYNFRFEEPDDEFLKRYPRTMSYVRPRDERRGRRRAELRQRKEAEKRAKLEEIARLKALKLKEIHEKIAKLKEVTGNDQLAFNDEDIEGDFEPEQHDRRMRAIFDDQYYGDTDDKKPVFPDLDEELEIENWEKYEGEFDQDHTEGAEEPHCEDDDFNMDADYDPKKARENLLEELTRGMGKKRRNRKKKSKLAQLLEEEKPKFVPEAERSYAQFMEEYYGMDCEDVIGGDLPTRFKYRQVVPNDYGLSIEEILLADDKELTQWVPLKKLVKHRPAAAERGEVGTYALKAADVQLKRRILPSLFKELPQEPELVVPVEAGKKKKKKKKAKTNEVEDKKEDLKKNGADNNDRDVKQKSKKSKESDVNSKNEEDDSKTEEVSLVEEIAELTEVKNKKKKKKKHREQNENVQNEPNADHESAVEVEESKNTEAVLKEKNKKRKNNFTIENLPNGEEPSTPSDVTQRFQSKGKKNKQKSTTEKPESQGNKLKRKLEQNAQESSEVPKKKNKPNKTNVNKSNKKNKINKNNKKINKDAKTDNPLNKLSDERLKAYGLNPKKYRGFLKYKKF